MQAALDVGMPVMNPSGVSLKYVVSVYAQSKPNTNEYFSKCFFNLPI